ncbi:MAG: tripartite tricarboxylate transporter substrate binding protein [Betaproteobacteria bacterium]|nr:tripartite tricarboxylate transporter substrate binding protein [Betaproteobacteria bacterium]
MKISAMLCGACLVAVSNCASAQIRSTGSGQDYPSKPIRVIVGFSAGGPTDLVARLIGAKLTEAWGQQIVVDNRAGASSMIGTELVARSVPDGYTLLVGTGTALTIAPLLRSKVPYDPVKDFAPVSLLVINPQILVVNNTVPVNSVKDLIALAKSKPGQLNYASGGEGSTPHLGMELLKSLAGIDIAHVPYKGTSLYLIDLIAGQVQMMFNSMPTVLPLVKSGKLKGLAVSSAQRSPAAPDLPTVAEAGVPNFETVGWYGMLAPARTPQGIVAKLNAQVVKILTQPEMAQRLAGEGADPAPGPPESLAKFMRVETERLKKLIKFAGLKPT